MILQIDHLTHTPLLSYQKDAKIPLQGLVLWYLTHVHRQN